MTYIFHILKTHKSALFAFTVAFITLTIGVISGKRNDNFTLNIVCEDSPAGNFGYEIAKAFAVSEGMRIERLLENNPDKQTAILLDNKCDLVAQPTAVIDRENDEISYTAPFYTTRLVLLQHLNKREISTLRQLTNETIIFANNAAVRWRMSTLSLETARAFHTKEIKEIGQDELIKRLNRDTTFVSICPEIEALNYTHLYDSLKIAIPIGFDQEYAWIVQTEDTTLKSKMDTFITEFTETKAYRDIFAKHFKLIKQQ